MNLTVKYAYGEPVLSWKWWGREKFMSRTQIILTVGRATYFMGYLGRTATQRNVTDTGIFTK
jgi:hypothetical protein